MKIFLDTANIEAIKEAVSWGIVDGVTTNPTLIAREGKDFLEVLYEICQLVDGPVSAEVVAMEHEGMIEEARLLSKIAPNIVIKIPMTVEGLKAVKVLESEGIRTNVTLVFSPAQALLAAKAGATFVSPFIGRLDDISNSGMAIIEDIVTIFENYDFKTQVIAASIRHPMHVVEAALAGAHIATVPFEVLKKMTGHALTDAGIKRFLQDWEKVPNRNIKERVKQFLEKKGV